MYTIVIQRGSYPKNISALRLPAGMLFCFSGITDITLIHICYCLYPGVNILAHVAFVWNQHG
jgi:hypothetical protein